MPDDRAPSGAFLVTNGARCIVADIGDIVAPQRIAQQMAQMLAQVISRPEAAAQRLLLVRAFAFEIDRAVEQIEAGGDVAIEEVRVRVAQIQFGPPAGKVEPQANILPSAEEIALAQANIADRAFGGGVACAQRQLAGG